MKYVRVRDKKSGHEFSTPENDPGIKKGWFEVVSRKAPTSIPLPPKFKKNLSPAGGTKKEEQ
ncbi:hypothetical protein ACTXM8_04695 [Brachybacterium alimentarium]|uniref:hypothetical protein n=1 Tax=Brachybacterium alimentarium TaxID=47845 RepID=UPI003FD30FE1